jgi:hypothetical protein
MYNYGERKQKEEEEAKLPIYVYLLPRLNTVPLYGYDKKYKINLTILSRILQCIRNYT